MIRALGFTLIELLVALVVISIGILGMLALQTQSFQASQESYDRTQAVFYMQQLEQRMMASTDQGVTIFTTQGNTPSVFNTVRASLIAAVPDATIGLAQIPNPPPGNRTYRVTVTWPRKMENATEQMVVDVLL